jgi:hypothetical protein
VRSGHPRQCLKPARTRPHRQVWSTKEDSAELQGNTQLQQEQIAK